MTKINKVIIVFLAAVILSGSLYAPVFAEDNESSLQELIQTMRQRIEELRAQIEELRIQLRERSQEVNQIREENKEIKGEIKEQLSLIKQLRKGMRGSDVTLLQEILATDSEIYPEGLVTGYFGPLTERAVKRFQKKMGVEQVDLVGPKTLSKINELLTEGAGSSGKVPPGLLIAPGILKKITFIPQPLPGQKLPFGIAKKLGFATTTDDNGTSTPDIEPPLISELIATSTIATSTKVVWLTDELADSKVYYDTLSPLVIATSTPVVSSADLVLNHEFSLLNLTASTTYYYLVTSSDSEGNISTSSEQFFITLSE